MSLPARETGRFVIRFNCRPEIAVITLHRALPEAPEHEPRRGIIRAAR
jgi:hypothetical protein